MFKGEKDFKYKKDVDERVRLKQYWGTKGKDYKHIELVEDSVKITANRIEDGKISNIKNWTPESFLLRVVAVVTKGTGDNRKRKVKKRIFSFNNVTMKSALDEVVIAHKLLLKEIKSEWSTEETITKVSSKKN